MQKGNITDQSLTKSQSTTIQQLGTNDLLKRLYTFTKNRSVNNFQSQKAFSHIVKIHKNVFTEIHKGILKVEKQKTDIQKEIQSYKPQKIIKIEDQIMQQCVSLFALFQGKDQLKIKQDIKHQQTIKKQQKFEEKIKEKEQQQAQLLKKQKQYLQKVKLFQKQKQFYERKKKQDALKKQQFIKKQQEKIKKQKQLEMERQKQEKKKKLEEGLKLMQEKRKKRLETIKQLALQSKRSHSMKALGQSSVPKYIELQRQYLQNERKKAESLKDQQKQKRQSMQLKIQEIKNHQKQYIEKIKAKFTSSKNKNKTQKQGRNVDTQSMKVRSEFNVIKSRDEQEEMKYRQKAARRKQFQNKLRTIPINIDVNKRKQKQIEIDKAVNRQKYILLGSRRLDDEIIYKEFRNFQVTVDPKIIGKNYLNQIKLAPKAPKSQRIGKEKSLQSLNNKSEKKQYPNYLEQLRMEGKIQRKSQKKLSQTASLLKLVQDSKKLLKKSNQQNLKSYESTQKPIIKEPKIKVFSETKNLPNQIKMEQQKSITEKIVEYQRKVLRKVNDLKKISRYDESIQKQQEMDNLYSKVLQAKLNSIGSV